MLMQAVPALGYLDIFATLPPFVLEREPEEEACVGKHGGFLFLYPGYFEFRAPVCNKNLTIKSIRKEDSKPDSSTMRCKKPKNVTMVLK